MRCSASASSDPESVVAGEPAAVFEPNFTRLIPTLLLAVRPAVVLGFVFFQGARFRSLVEALSEGQFHYLAFLLGFFAMDLWLILYVALGPMRQRVCVYRAGFVFFTGRSFEEVRFDDISEVRHTRIEKHVHFVHVITDDLFTVVYRGRNGRKTLKLTACLYNVAELGKMIQKSVDALKNSYTDSHDEGTFSLQRTGAKE